MSFISEHPQRQAITDALTRLPLLPNVEHEISSAVDTVLLWMNPVYPSSHFSNIGRRKVKKEIDGIAEIVENLNEAFRRMHRPTFELLYDKGIRPQDVTKFCMDIRNACQDCDVTNLPVTVPRKKTVIAPQNIAITLAHYYQLLTGEHATVSTLQKGNKASGHFFRLVKEVFEALSITASAESCAREAAGRKRAQRKQAKSPC